MEDRALDERECDDDSSFHKPHIWHSYDEYRTARLVGRILERPLSWYPSLEEAVERCWYCTGPVFQSKLHSHLSCRANLSFLVYHKNLH